MFWKIDLSWFVHISFFIQVGLGGSHRKHVLRTHLGTSTATPIAAMFTVGLVFSFVFGYRWEKSLWVQDRWCGAKKKVLFW